LSDAKTNRSRCGVIFRPKGMRIQQYSNHKLATGYFAALKWGRAKKMFFFSAPASKKTFFLEI
jgi:hypothetical protein